MVDASKTLDRLSAQAGRLYSLPAVAMKVLELTNNPRVDARALKECIENDPALTAKILRVVNSSVFGLSRSVSDLNQALALLGTKPLKLLVLGFSLPPSLSAGVSGDVLGRYWRHALTKAVAARALSETLYRAAGDDAFIAGLLQDIGILLLVQQLGEPYLKLMEKVDAAGGDLRHFERESMGFDHTELSARLLAQWGLPDNLVEAVGSRAEPSADVPGSDPGARAAIGDPSRRLVDILGWAECIARLLADQRREALGRLLELGESHKDWSPRQLESLVATLQEKVEQLADVLSLQLPAGMEYRDLLAEAQQQLADVAADAASDLLRARARQSGDEESLKNEVDQLSRTVEEMLSRSEPPAQARPAGSAPSPNVASQAADAPARQRAAEPRAATPSLFGQPGAMHGAERPSSPPARAAKSGAAPMVDPSALLHRLQIAVEACRQSRRGLSLLLAEVDHPDRSPSGGGEGSSATAVDRLRAAVQSLGYRLVLCQPFGDAGVAVILPGCDRMQAVELGWQLVDAMKRSARTVEGSQVGVSVGVAAVAIPPRNFPPSDLLDGAQRCLYASRASGGGVVKSIETY